MDIIVIGTREYNWALKPFAYLFDKHWGAHVVHWGDEDSGHLPFRQCPAYGKEWPWDHWFGNGLRSILEVLESDVFCLLLPDHWISAPVDRAGVAAMAQYMLRDPTILRGNLTIDMGLATYGELERRWWDRDIMAVHPTQPQCGFLGAVTFCPALWNRELLMHIVEPHWTIWECEKLGTDQKVTPVWPEIRSVGIEPGPIRRTHSMGHGQEKTVSLEGLSLEDAKAVRAMMPGEWKVRG